MTMADSDLDIWKHVFDLNIPIKKGLQSPQEY